jgi:mRNA interferase MazF
MAMVTFERFNIYLVNLDPTVGSEIQKTRPCVIISPNEMNKYIKTVIVAPMTTKSRAYPSRLPITFNGKTGQIILDQIKTVDKEQLVKKIGSLPSNTALKISEILIEMFSY